MEFLKLLIILSYVLVMVFLSYRFLSRVLIDSKLTYEKMYSELYNYSLLWITKLILEKLLNSDNDANGSKVALRNISDISEPFYQGVIVTIIGNMSNEMKYRFYTFFKKRKNDSSLISNISSIIEVYSMEIMRRIKIYESEVNKLNRTAISQNQKVMDSSEFIYGKLIESIVNDVKYLSSNRLVSE